MKTLEQNRKIQIKTFDYETGITILRTYWLIAGVTVYLP